MWEAAFGPPTHAAAASEAAIPVLAAWTPAHQDRFAGPNRQTSAQNTSGPAPAHDSEGNTTGMQAITFHFRKRRPEMVEKVQSLAMYVGCQCKHGTQQGKMNCGDLCS